METWLETFRSVKLKPGSYDATESNYLCHIKPFLGDYQPRHITSLMLQNLINERTNYLGHSSLSKVFSVLKQVFTYLWNEGLIERNLMGDVSSVTMPKEEDCLQSDDEIYYLEIDEVLRIEKVIEEQVQKAWKSDKWHKNSIARYGYIVLFMRNTGLRKGEILALEWEDLWSDRQRVNINKSLGLIKNRNWQEGEPQKYMAFRNA